ncbi:membrane protein DedA with SNARE-associated domain [Deinococcus metalli]|uniref:Alkaline phosphatase n=1 Tax=Deinococcus metalli TaxID=1141878 RepID=A0A7W8NRR9_9DEIO|nr:DedA family protein [Deinococcus metalli]MBB5377193.1 membrane protein DedA with SNARE-associated domain [Deinococcus metalli]GHF48276.1 alkaline phosphatase [Deinococcus metalli]
MNLRVWLAGLDPAVLDVSTFGLLALEGAGIPGIPGVVPMLAQVAAIDAGRTTLGAAIAWGVAGNWLGSLLGYAVSRWGGRWLPAGWRERLAGERATTLLARYGAPLIVVSRTIGSLRTPMTLVAGSSGYPLGRYALLSFLGALLHVGVWQTLLWKAGPAILPQMERWGREILIGAAVVIVLLVLVRRWTRPA